ncbi:host cell division inhibitor Icd-like protein [Rodentibacter heidelbergensis]|uniref:host cell division inhibitor Icd-like protein n=1 Tax=Rodentibacter heidelbergensis TaxID=1908258 RepID=UPI000986A46F|nr:host cell division inhibitor Icd-like protein [Rodentibacter heidelbergensis]
MKNEQAYYSQKSSIYHQTHKKSRILSNSALTVKTKLNYIKSALAKSKAGHCKIVFIHKANSTPNRAFFVRSVYAPIQYSLFSDSLFSMVAHNGKGSALCRVPCVTVLQPVMCYRPSLQTLAVVPQNLHKDTAEMIYKFLCVNRTHPHFNLCVQTIQANNETNARLSLSADFQCLSLIAKINPKFDRTFTQGGIYA